MVLNKGSLERLQYTELEAKALVEDGKATDKLYSALNHLRNVFFEKKSELEKSNIDQIRQHHVEAMKLADRLAKIIEEDAINEKLKDYNSCPLAEVVPTYVLVSPLAL